MAKEIALILCGCSPWSLVQNFVRFEILENPSLRNFDYDKPSKFLEILQDFKAIITQKTQILSQDFRSILILFQFNWFNQIQCKNQVDFSKNGLPKNSQQRLSITVPQNLRSI